MKKKEIILCLLPIYKRAITHINELGDVKIAKHILAVFCIQFGVCNAIRCLLTENYNHNWIKRYYKDSSNIWERFPIEADTTDEMTKLLQIRVDIMEKELKRKWWHIFK